MDSFVSDIANSKLLKKMKKVRGATKRTHTTLGMAKTCAWPLEDLQEISAVHPEITLAQIHLLL